LARLALHGDRPTEQPRDLAADRQPESGAAVLPARRAICLLERLENEAQLVFRDADAAVRDGKCDHGVRLVECMYAEVGVVGGARSSLLMFARNSLLYFDASSSCSALSSRPSRASSISRFFASRSCDCWVSSCALSCNSALVRCSSSD